MASLVDAARRAREQAARDRARAEALRVDVREHVARSRDLVAQACTSYARRRQLGDPVPLSAWSTLPWRQPDEELDVVLTLVS